jgi:hypothetical protein
MRRAGAAHRQIGRGRSGPGGFALRYLSMMGSRVSLGQNFGAPIARKQAAFQ